MANSKLKRWVAIGTILYALFVMVICFMPQPQLTGYTTPGIVKWGRLVFLLRPFNSLLSLGQVTSLGQLAWIISQNLLNVFLLYPLMTGLLLLFPSLRFWKKAVAVAFMTSCFIEFTQLFLDFAIDANRVFEIDDLITNTLGGYLAYLTINYFKKRGAE